MVINRLCPRKRGLTHLQHARDIFPQFAGQFHHPALFEINQRRLDLPCRACDLAAGQARAAARHCIGPVQDQRAPRRVEVCGQHDAGRGFAAQQGQRIPAAMPCNQQIPLAICLHDQRLLQADHLDALCQLVNVPLVVAVVLILVNLGQRDVMHLHGVRIGHRRAQQRAYVKPFRHRPHLPGTPAPMRGNPVPRLRWATIGRSARLPKPTYLPAATAGYGC